MSVRFESGKRWFRAALLATFVLTAMVALIISADSDTGTALWAMSVVFIAGAVVLGGTAFLFGWLIGKEDPSHSETSANTAPCRTLSNSTPTSGVIGPDASPTPKPDGGGGGGELEPLSRDESLWADALSEFESAARRPGLWARVFAEASGDEPSAKAAYLANRVAELRRARGAEIAASEERAQEEGKSVVLARASMPSGHAASSTSDRSSHGVRGTIARSLGILVGLWLLMLIFYGPFGLFVDNSPPSKSSASSDSDDPSKSNAPIATVPEPIAAAVPDKTRATPSEPESAPLAAQKASALPSLFGTISRFEASTFAKQYPAKYGGIDHTKTGVRFTPMALDVRIPGAAYVFLNIRDIDGAVQGFGLRYGNDRGLAVPLKWTIEMERFAMEALRVFIPQADVKAVMTYWKKHRYDDHPEGVGNGRLATLGTLGVAAGTTAGDSEIWIGARDNAASAPASGPPDSPGKSLTSLVVRGKTLTLTDTADSVFATLRADELKSQTTNPDPAIPGSLVVVKHYRIGGRQFALTFRRQTIDGAYVLTRIEPQ